MMQIVQGKNRGNHVDATQIDHCYGYGFQFTYSDALLTTVDAYWHSQNSQRTESNNAVAEFQH